MFRFTNQDGKVGHITEEQALKLLVDDAKKRLKELEGKPLDSVTLPTGTISWAEDKCHYVFLMFGSFRAVLEDHREWTRLDIKQYWLSKGLSMSEVTVFEHREGLPSLGEGNPNEYSIHFRNNHDGGSYEQKIKAIHPFIAATCLWQLHGKDITITEMYKVQKDYTIRCETECFWPEYWTLPVGWYDFFEEYYRIKRMKTQNQIQKTIKQGAMNSFLMVFETEFSAYFGGIKPLEISDRMHYSKPYLKLKLPFTDLVFNIPKI